MIVERRIALQVVFTAERNEDAADILHDVADWIRRERPPLHDLIAIGFEQVDRRPVLTMSFRALPGELNSPQPWALGL